MTRRRPTAEELADDAAEQIDALQAHLTDNVVYERITVPAGLIVKCTRCSCMLMGPVKVDGLCWRCRDITQGEP